MATACSIALRADEPGRRRIARYRPHAWRGRFREDEVVLDELKRVVRGEGRAAREGGPFAFGRRVALSAVSRCGRPEREAPAMPTIASTDGTKLYYEEAG